MTKPFIVAEMSANHLGDFDRAKAIVHAAAEAGASAVKLQTWSPRSMCIDDTILESGTWAGGWKLSDLYEEACTPWSWHKPLFDLCKELGMIGFSTPFDKEAANFLEELDCPLYKIASFELVDIPLIKHVAGFGKPMIISTGMASKQEIIRAALHANKCNNLTIMQCVSAYPADASETNLIAIEDFVGNTGIKWGISDHSPGIGVAVAAIARGALVVEKHFTLNRTDGGLDASFSIEPHEFKQLVTECSRAAAAIGTIQYGCKNSESIELRRSLYVTANAKQGDTITLENIGTARPAKGLEPYKLDSILGMTFCVDVKRGMPLKEELFR